MNKYITACILSGSIITLPAVFSTSKAQAATTVTDGMSITVGVTCTFDASAHTYSTSLGLSGVNNNIGTTAMKVTCNKHNGYSVKGVMTALTNSSATSNTIPYYTGTGSGKTGTPAAGTSVWAVYNNTDSAYILSSSTSAFWTATANTSGTTKNLVYRASTSAWLPTGTYTGTATYTLTAAS